MQRSVSQKRSGGSACSLTVAKLQCHHSLERLIGINCRSLEMPAFGKSQTSRDVRLESAKWVKADVEGLSPIAIL
jgi:hypothetical protein